MSDWRYCERCGLGAYRLHGGLCEWCRWDYELTEQPAMTTPQSEFVDQCVVCGADAVTGSELCMRDLQATARDMDRVFYT